MVASPMAAENIECDALVFEITQHIFNGGFYNIWAIRVLGVLVVQRMRSIENKNIGLFTGRHAVKSNGAIFLQPREKFRLNNGFAYHKNTRAGSH